MICSGCGIGEGTQVWPETIFGLNYCPTCQELSIAFSLPGRAPCSQVPILPGPQVQSPPPHLWPPAGQQPLQPLPRASGLLPCSNPPHPPTPVIGYVGIWCKGNCTHWNGTPPSQCPQLWVFPLGLFKLTPPEPSSKVFLAPGADPHTFLASWLLGWEWDCVIALANF